MGQTLEPQQQIAHYRVAAPLGAGGMGEVYLARDETLERNVALKILPPALVGNEQRLRRFILEAKSASSLNHPNIVTIYEIGSDLVRGPEGEPPVGGASKPVHYIAMEYVQGETLGDAIHREKADLRMLVGYLAQVAEGLAKAHAAGIVHRDLKPGNVMVTTDGFAKVLDFGLAKLTERSSDSEDVTATAGREALTGHGMVVGTAGYMSPEQVAGRAVDARSDIFSFGCMLYEAAARQRPFVGDTAVDTLHKILNEKPRPVEELNPRVPADLRRVIRRCLAKSADQRYQSIKDVAIELREIGEQWEALPISSTSDSGAAGMASGASSAVPRRSRRWMLAGAAAILVVGLLATTSVFLPRIRNASSPGPTEAPLPTITSVISGSGLEQPALSPDGRYLAYLKVDGGRTGVIVRQISTGVDIQVIEPQDGPAPRSFSFSPDGDYLYFLRASTGAPLQTALFAVPSLGGSPRRLAALVGSAVNVSPDGKRLAFWREAGSDGGELVTLDPASGKERGVAKIKAPPYPTSRLAWSEDGRTLRCLFYRTDWITGEAQTVAFDADTGAQRTLHTWPDIVPMTSGVFLPGGEVIVAGSDLPQVTPNQLWLLRMADGSRRRLTNDESSYDELTGSFDGRVLAARRITSPAALFSIPASGEGEPRQLAIPERQPNLDAVADDGTIVYTVASGAAAALWAVKPDGTGRRQLTPERLRAFGGFLLPGTRTLLVAALDERRKLAVWRTDLDGTELTRLTRGDREWLFDASRDGRYCLFATNDGGRGALWRLALDGRSGPEKVTEEYTNDGKFSPDGKYVALGRYEGTDASMRPVIVVVPSTGGAPVATLPRGAHIRSYEWSEDDSALIYVTGEGGVDSVMRWPIASGKPALLFRFPQGRISWFWWSPDRRTLLFTARAGQAMNAWIWRVGTPSPQQLTRFPTGTIYNCSWSPDGTTLFLKQGVPTTDIVLIRGIK